MSIFGVQIKKQPWPPVGQTNTGPGSLAECLELVPVQAKILLIVTPVTFYVGIYQFRIPSIENLFLTNI